MTYEDLIEQARNTNETDIDTIILKELNKFPYELFEIQSLECLLLDDWLAQFEVRERDFDKLVNLKNLNILSLISNRLVLLITY